MAGPLLIAWLAGAGWACEDLRQNVEWAQAEVLEVNEGAARQLLDTAELGIGCGAPESAEDLARFFLIDAATAAIDGDEPAMQDSFAAAARISPDTWIEDLGPKMFQEYETAAGLPTSTGRIEIDAPGWETRLNGRATAFPTDVPNGLHIVEIVDDGTVAWGKIVWVLAGEVQNIEPGLEPKVVVPVEPVKPVREKSSDPGVRLSIGAGAMAAFGDELTGVTGDGDAVTEPGTKITFPLELGVWIKPETLWVRPTIGLAPLIGGQFLWAADDGAGTSGFALLGDLAAGVGVGEVAVGASAGVAYPGRIALRAVGGAGLGDTPLFAELRAGVNVATGGRTEPAVGLAVSARVP